MSSLFSEQTIGIFLYSKDCVELEQMGGKDKNLHVTPLSCGIIIYIGDKKLLFDFMYTFWSKVATSHSPQKNQTKKAQYTQRLNIQIMKFLSCLHLACFT